MEFGFDIYTSRTLLWFALLATLQLALVPFSLGTIGASADLETCTLHIRIAGGITFSLALLPFHFSQR